MADWRARGRRLKKFVIDNFLPLAFLVAIVWALAWPAPGEAVIGVSVRGRVGRTCEVPAIFCWLCAQRGPAE
jgi:sodium/bile acid cotransporter 7